MTNYLYYDYANSMVAKVKETNTEYEKASSIHSYLNKECLKNGSSLTGRKEAFMYLVHKKKYIPIMVSTDPLTIYFPTSSVSDPTCIWVNFSSIQKIEYRKKTCTIIFNDGTCLECNSSERIKDIIRSIYRYLYLIKD